MPFCSQEAYQAAEDLLQQPLKLNSQQLMLQEAAARNVELPKYSIEMPDDESMLYSSIRTASERKYREALAKEDRVTIFTPQDMYNKMFTEAREINGDEDFDFAREFLSQYGVSLPKTDQYGVPFTRTDLESERARNLLDRIRTGFSRMPREFVEEAKIRGVLLTRGGHLASAYTDSKGALAGYITFDVTSTDNQSEVTVMHEIFHQWDARSCGSNVAADHDPGFSGLKGAHNRTEGQAVDDYAMQLREAEIGLELAYESGGPKEVSDARMELANRTHDIFSATGYSRISTDIEEKAELARGFIDSELHARYLDPNVPVIRREYTYLYARLLERNSHVARYFLDMTYEAH